MGPNLFTAHKDADGLPLGDRIARKKAAAAQGPAPNAAPGGKVETGEVDLGVAPLPPGPSGPSEVEDEGETLAATFATFATVE
jgi:hypothetical protein